MKLILAVGFLLAFATGVNAQKQRTQTYLPKIAIKTNALYWATSTPNLGLEIGLAKKLTLDISGNYNPWKFSDNKQLKHWLVQPELRYWLCERFNGSFFGLHGHYADADISNLDMFGLGHDRYDGKIYGAGISYGYQWMISPQWNLEAGLSLGYAHLNYKRYGQPEGAAFIEKSHCNYWGPTQIGISLVYFIQ